MSTLTPQEQLLFDAAKKALPRFLFDEDPTVQEVLAAFAKVFAKAWDQVALYVDGTRIGTADDTQIEQHAADRGTRRRNGESTESLRSRLRFLDDRVTPGAIKSAATAAMAEITVPSGYPGLVELRRDRAFLGGAVGSYRSFLSRGHRMTGEGRAAMEFIVILPYASTQAIEDAVTEAVRLIKAAGIVALVERRLNP